MPRLVSVLLIAGAFGTGFAAGGLRGTPPAPPASSQPSPVVADLQRQVAELQQRLQAQETELMGLRQRGAVLPEAPPAARRARAPRVLPPPVQLPVPAATDAVPADADTVEASLPAPPPATEQQALQRFQRYVEGLERLTPRERQERFQAFTDELRAMGEPAVTALLSILEVGESGRDRRVAASLLGALQEARALPALQEILERDPDLLLRRVAAGSLRQLQLPETLPVLTRTLANAQDDRLVRISAAYGLAQLGDAQGTAGLMQLFDDAASDGQGRLFAFRALMTLNDPVALPLMRQLTASDADVGYRVAAMRFLARNGDQAALPILQQILDSPQEQPSVLEAATQAYEAIMQGKRPTATR